MELCEVLETVKDLSRKKDVTIYLVGGALRDYLLNHQVNDFDFVVEGTKEDIEEICSLLSKLLEGTYFVLDTERGVFRVNKKGLSLDFNQLQGESINDDLSLRDFTCNALALSLHSKNLLDPFNGINDIKKKTLKVINKNVFKDDPLRLLRAVRFKFFHGFKLNDKTEKLLIKDSEKIKEVTGERIQEELMKLFKSDKISEIVSCLEDDFNLLSRLFPEIVEMKNSGQCHYHQEDIWTHSKFLLKVIEELLTEKKLKLREYRNNILDKKTLIRLAGLLHDIGKIETEQTSGEKTYFPNHGKVGAELVEDYLEKLRFSKEDISFVTGLIFFHMRPLDLYCAPDLTEKGIFRFLRKAGSLTPGVCLLSAADVISTRNLNGLPREGDKYLEFIKSLLSYYRRWDKEKERLLLDGKDIMDIFDLEQGPLIGELKDGLRQAQALGKVEDKQMAVSYLKELLFKYNHFSN